MATQVIKLTDAWQLVSSTAFIAQKSGPGIVLITNSVGAPTGTIISHSLKGTEPLQFSIPTTGEWYAKDKSVVATSLVYTEV